MRIKNCFFTFLLTVFCCTDTTAALSVQFKVKKIESFPICFQAEISPNEHSCATENELKYAHAFLDHYNNTMQTYYLRFLKLYHKRNNAKLNEFHLKNIEIHSLTKDLITTTCTYFNYYFTKTLRYLHLNISENQHADPKLIKNYFTGLEKTKIPYSVFETCLCSYGNLYSKITENTNNSFEVSGMMFHLQLDE
jgi:hypothetical protein